MSYSDLYLKSRNPPSFFLYILAFLAIGGVAVTFLRTPAPEIRASKQTLLYHSLVNLSAHQVGIYYQTANKTTSWVIYGPDKGHLDHAAFDERDTESTKSSTNLHYVLLKDLQDNTSYTYKIIAEGEVVSVNTVDSYNFKTVKNVITSSASSPPAYGKVIGQDNQPIDGGFVIYYYPGAYPLVSLVKGGDWLVPLNSLVNKTTGKGIIANAHESVKIQIINEELKNTSFETTLENTTPLTQTVILGNVYHDNILGENVTRSPIISTKPKEITPTPSKSISPTKTGTVSIPHTSPTKVIPPLGKSSEKTVEITFPKEQAVIPGSRPLIKGHALSNAPISITIRSIKGLVYSTKFISDQNGDWKVSLPLPLSPAVYTLSVTTKGTNDLPVTILRRFTTAKSGEEVVLGTATGEATLTPTIPILTPTIDLLPTTVYITSTPIPVTPTPTQLITGENDTMVILGSMALVVIGAGVLLIF